MAQAPPSGPVFLSIPQDLLDEEGDPYAPRASTVTHRARPDGLDECAKHLCQRSPEEVAIIAGEEVALSGAFDLVVGLAESLGCDVFGPAIVSASVFPTDHPLWRGMLGTTAADQHHQLSRYRTVLNLGGPIGYTLGYTPARAIPIDVVVLHITADASQLGRTYPATVGVLGDLRAGLEVLLDLVNSDRATDAAELRLSNRREEMRHEHRRANESVLRRWDDRPMHAMVAIQALLAGLPDAGIVVDEAMSADIHLRRLYRSRYERSFYACRSGGLGWGMPFALGVQLAEPTRPVLCVVGDGAAQYSIQSLYSATKYRLPVVFAVLNNGQYRVLVESLRRAGGRSAETLDFAEMALNDPPIDVLDIARGYGVRALRLEAPDDAAEAVRSAFESGEPTLLDLRVVGVEG
jgi:benzoylformate decarboxylase